MDDWILLLPMALQGGVIAIDEHLHRRRGLPRWERLGHPLDTLTVLAGLALTWLPPTPVALKIFVGWAVFSCLFVTKDEAVHVALCSPREQWLHALLFMLHPLVFAAFGWSWYEARGAEYRLAYFVLTAVFLVYQTVYWNFWRAADDQ